MKEFKELKKSIEPRMKRCWGECCALFFISAGGIAAGVFAWYLTMNYLLTVQIINSMNDPISLLAALGVFVFMWLISVPYRYGVRWYRLQQVRGHSVHAKSVFSCYFSTKRMFQVYRMSLMLFLKKSIFLAPFLCLLGAAINLITRLNSNSISTVYNILVVVLLMLSVVAYIAYNVVNVKYASAPYIFVLGFDRPAKEIISDSVRFTKDWQGYMVEVLRNCAFMLLPCILIFPMIFVIPKMMMIYTAAINEMVENGFAEDKLVVTERRG